MIKLSDNEIAVLCLTLICIVAIAVNPAGSKEIALALGGGIAGWLGKSATTGGNQ